MAASKSWSEMTPFVTAGELAEHLRDKKSMPLAYTLGIGSGDVRADRVIVLHNCMTVEPAWPRWLRF